MISLIFCSLKITLFVSVRTNCPSSIYKPFKFLYNKEIIPKAIKLNPFYKLIIVLTYLTGERLLQNY
jgi:hypothetical protein